MHDIYLGTLRIHLSLNVFYYYYNCSYCRVSKINTLALQTLQKMVQFPKKVSFQSYTDSSKYLLFEVTGNQASATWLAEVDFDIIHP